MRDFADTTRRLAELAVGFGANVQPGQIVSVVSSIGQEELTRAVTRAAYEHGARYVDVLYFDPWVKRERIALAPEDSLDDVPPWMIERLEWISDQRAARINLTGPAAPHALDGLDPARAGRDLMPYLPNSGAVVNKRTTNWTVVPAPTLGWAREVFPEAADDEAYARLWDAVAHVCRLDDADPVAAWLTRMERLTSVAKRVSERRFDAIRLRGPGTDLTIGLFRSSFWHAADFETVDGLRHFPNLPSEEMFTTPDPTRVDGYVSTTLPKELYGSILDGMRLEFENGAVTGVEAERGEDALRSLVAKDEGASRLGELALVDGEGRIGPLGIVFVETLLDENAASHIALGNGLQFAVRDESERKRVNRSGIHVDLMIGRPELEVDGITDAGEHVPLLRGGAWQI
jgi:aminopeptidase